MTQKRERPTIRDTLQFIWLNRKKIPWGWRIILAVLALAAAIGLAGALYCGARELDPADINACIDNSLACIAFAIIGIAHSGLLLRAILHDTPEVIRLGAGRWQNRE